jgi:putative flippase GtrA
VPSARDLVRRWATPETATFLAVGGVGYVVDVSVFNVLRSSSAVGYLDLSTARVLAAIAAIAVNYVGNRTFTWRNASRGDRKREVALFFVFSVIGLGFSVATLAISHDLLGLTGRFADNVSANVVGLGLGTMFRFWSYRRFVFDPGRSQEAREEDVLVHS